MNAYLEIHWKTFAQTSLDLTDGIVSMFRKQSKVRDAVPAEVWSRNSTVESDSSNYEGIDNSRVERGVLTSKCHHRC